MTDSSEQRIQALEAELAALRADMQAFTATVSHDLRAPLRHISAYAELVQEDAAPQLSAEVQGFLTTIADSARHMAVLLDGLTALSRLGTVPVHVEPVPLQSLVQEVSEELMATQAARTVEWRIATDLPVVQADASLLRQAVAQLLGNALKFTAPREVAQIAVQASATQGRVRLQVRDNGVGYNPAMQTKLFQVFGRLHSPMQFEGIGMGLVLARKALQRMDGHVDTEGLVDGGCCATLEVPGA